MERRANLTIVEKPRLRRPHMVCGISGWVDGGEAATGSVKYLVGKLNARRFAEMPIARFHIYQVPGQVSLRPHIRIEDGLLKEHRFPNNQFFYWINPAADNDLVLFLGTEPNMNWEEYADAILHIAEQFAVIRIYLLGGVLDKCPHTKEPTVSCACTAPGLKGEMRRYGVQFTSYEGPGRFGTTLLHLCQERAFDMVAITARATYYPEFNVGIPHNPKAIRALVKRLNHLLSLKLDLSDLDRAAEELEGKLSFMTSQSADFRAYIEQLEKDFAEVKFDEPLEMSGEEAVEMAEEFLKREKDD